MPKKGKIAKALQKAEITKALRGMEVGTFKISRRALQERYNLSDHLAEKLAREFKQANNMTGEQAAKARKRKRSKLATKLMHKHKASLTQEEKESSKTLICFC